MYTIELNDEEIMLILFAVPHSAIMADSLPDTKIKLAELNKKI